MRENVISPLAQIPNRVNRAPPRPAVYCRVPYPVDRVDTSDRFVVTFDTCQRYCNTTARPQVQSLIEYPGHYNRHYNGHTHTDTRVQHTRLTCTPSTLDTHRLLVLPRHSVRYQAQVHTVLTRPALALPEMRTAYLTMADLLPRDW